MRTSLVGLQRSRLFLAVLCSTLVAAPWFTDVFPLEATETLVGAAPVAELEPLLLLLLSEHAMSSMLQPSTPTPTARIRFT